MSLPNPLLFPPYWSLLLADFRSVLFPLPHLLVLSNIPSRTNDSRKRCICYTTSMYVTQSWCFPDEIDLCHFRICIIAHNNNLFNKKSMYSLSKFCPQKPPIYIAPLFYKKQKPFTLLPSVNDGSGTSKTASNPKIINILCRVKKLSTAPS